MILKCIQIRGDTLEFLSRLLAEIPPTPDHELVGALLLRVIFGPQLGLSIKSQWWRWTAGRVWQIQNWFNWQPLLCSGAFYYLLCTCNIWHQARWGETLKDFQDVPGPQHMIGLQVLSLHNVLKGRDTHINKLKSPICAQKYSDFHPNLGMTRGALQTKY